MANGAGGGPARTNSPANHVVPSQVAHNSPQPRPYHGGQSNPQQRSPPTSHPHGQQPAPPPSASQSSVNHTQQQQQQSQAAHIASQGLTALANALPPPPTSFAMRRAGQLGGRGNKPAGHRGRESQGYRSSSELCWNSQDTKSASLELGACTSATGAREEPHASAFAAADSFTEQLPGSAAVYSECPQPSHDRGRLSAVSL